MEKYPLPSNSRPCPRRPQPPRLLQKARSRLRRAPGAAGCGHRWSWAVAVPDAAQRSPAGSRRLDVLSGCHLLREACAESPGVGFPPRQEKEEKSKKRDEQVQAGRRGRQSSALTGSFSEGLRDAGWEEIHTALSSPRITFSHWLRLFLRIKEAGTRVFKKGFRGGLRRSSHPPPREA